MLELNNLNFEKEVLEASKQELVFVYFFAPWCGTCKLMEETINEAESEAGAKTVFAKVDVDASPDLAEKYEVMSLPTFKVFKDGRPVAALAGIKSKEELLKMLEN